MSSRVRVLAGQAAVMVGISLAFSQSALAQGGRFGDLADGPYDRLVIRNAMVIPGHGGPPVGPYDILIEQNMISEMVPSKS